MTSVTANSILLYDLCVLKLCGVFRADQDPAKARLPAMNDRRNQLKMAIIQQFTQPVDGSEPQSLTMDTDFWLNKLHSPMIVGHISPQLLGKKCWLSIPTLFDYYQYLSVIHHHRESLAYLLPKFTIVNQTIPKHLSTTIGLKIILHFTAFNHD